MFKKYMSVVFLVCCVPLPLLSDSLFDNCCGIYGSIQREMNASELKKYEVISKKYMTSTENNKRPNIFSD